MTASSQRGLNGLAEPRRHKLPRGQVHYVQRGEFKPFVAIQALLAAEEPRRVLEILYFGFCAWLLRPNDANFIGGYVILRSAVSLHNAAVRRQGRARKAGEDDRSLFESIGLLKSPYPRLLNEFFERLYGLKGLSVAGSVAKYREAFSEGVGGLEATAKLVGYMHMIHDHFADCGDASVNNACKLYGELERRHVTIKSVLRTEWSERAASAVWIYAASHTYKDPNKTLLSSIGSTRSYSHAKEMLPELAAKAVFVRELLKTGRQKSPAFKFEFESEPSPMPFPAASPSAQQADQIRQILKG